MKKYAYEYKEMSIAFNGMEFSHSLSGGYSEVSIDELLNKVTNMDSTWEICCSYKEQIMGEVGIYVQGTALVVSNKDLNSYCDETTHRYFDDSFGEIITSIDEMWTYNYANSEAIITDYEITGLWATFDYYLDNSDELEKIAKALNVEIHMVEETIKAGAWMYDDEEDLW